MLQQPLTNILESFIQKKKENPDVLLQVETATGSFFLIDKDLLNNDYKVIYLPLDYETSCPNVQFGKYDLPTLRDILKAYPNCCFTEFLPEIL